MEPLKDKVAGSWIGMAVGDAMGLAVKGLKPETIKQCFGQVDGFKDVKPFIGKGIKDYRMPGLYGTLTQSALAVCDSLLKNKKLDTTDIADSLQVLAAGGPENTFGVYRHPESYFYKAVCSLLNRPSGQPAEQNSARCSYVFMAVPIALFHQKESTRLLEECVETSLIMSRNTWEVSGAALTAFLVTRFLSFKPDLEAEFPLENEAKDLLQDAGDFCAKAESVFQKRFSALGQGGEKSDSMALSRTIIQLKDRLDMSTHELHSWICRNATAYIKQPINHPSQGHILTLIPLGLTMILKSANDFRSMMTASLNLGREAAKVGSLVGAWAGAFYGFSGIPEPWKTGLVNSRELKARGEALFLRRLPKNPKDLFEMEKGLTLKEFDEARGFLPKKKARKSPQSMVSWDDEFPEASPVPQKEDVAGRRKYQKDKTREKRNRRKNLGPDEGFL